MSIDDRLLQASPIEEKETDQEEEPEASTDRAGELRRRVRGFNAGSSADWQSSRGQRRKFGSKGVDAEGSIKQAPSQASLSTGSSRMLQSAWKNIVATFGFSFLYVYVHLFLRNVFGERFFAPLGAEWGDKPGMTVQQRDAKGSSQRMGETIGVAAVTLALLFLFLGILSVIAMIMGVVSNPLRSAIEILKSLFNLD
ncbi:MAG: hypothetical protein ACM3PZ_02250 [Bacillota bacterium]